MTALTREQAIERAADIVAEYADLIRISETTINGGWDDDDGKQEHDELLAIAAKLRERE